MAQTLSISIMTGLSNPHGIALSISQVPAGLRFDPNMIADQRFTVGTPCQPNLAHCQSAARRLIPIRLAPPLPAGTLL